MNFNFNINFKFKRLNFFTVSILLGISLAATFVHASEDIPNEQLHEDYLTEQDHAVIRGAISGAVIRTQTENAHTNLVGTLQESSLRYDKLRLRVLQCLGRRFDEHKNGMITIQMVAKLLEEWFSLGINASNQINRLNSEFDIIAVFDQQLASLNALLLRCKSLKEPLRDSMFSMIKDSESNKPSAQNLESFISSIYNSRVKNLLDNYIHGRLLCAPKQSGVNVSAAVVFGVGLGGDRRNCVSFFGNKYSVFSARVNLVYWGLGAQAQFEDNNTLSNRAGDRVGSGNADEYTEIKEYPYFSLRGSSKERGSFTVGLGSFCNSSVDVNGRNSKAQEGMSYGAGAYVGCDVGVGPVFRVPVPVSGSESAILRAIREQARQR
ncbi:MAG: hypothetical protein HQK53_07625 [Oligoflexia bacterium]|nr:hypothetical protein [Oligoflexia bacterium]